jgi:membrane associated rhomboid family serine protease
MIFVGDIDTFAVGASGALFGIAGLMVILTPNMPLYLMFIPIPIKAKYAIPGMLAVLWLISVTAGVPIGNTAHLGGLLAGVVYGIYLKNKYRRKTEYISRSFR